MINEPNTKAPVREIARMLGLDADDLAARVAMNNAGLDRAVKDGPYVATCVNKLPGMSLHQLDAKQNSTDPDELVQVLAGKVQRLAAMRERGGTGTRFEAEIRDVMAIFQRLFEVVIRRESAA